MKAVKFMGEGKVEIVNAAMPKITKGNQVLLKIRMAAICGSDLHITAVPQSHPCDIGTTMGHECVAEVFAVGAEVTAYRPGDRVAVDPIIPCGTCQFCREGRYNMCQNMPALGVQVDGVFAPYCLVSEDKLYPIPDSVSDRSAIFIEMLACVMNSVKRLHMVPGMCAAVFGAGPIGLAVAEVLKASGAGTTVIMERAPGRIQMARDLAVGDYVVDSGEPAYLEKVRDLTGGGPDIVVDTVGVLLPDCCTLVRNEGQILLIGINDHVRQNLLQFDIVRKELTIVAGYATFHTFTDVIKMLESRVIDVDRFLTHEFPLEEAGEALAVCRSGQALKTILTFSEADYELGGIANENESACN